MKNLLKKYIITRILFNKKKTHLVVNTNNNTTANPSVNKKQRFKETFGNLIATYIVFFV